MSEGMPSFKLVASQSDEPYIIFVAAGFTVFALRWYTTGSLNPRSRILTYVLHFYIINCTDEISQLESEFALTNPKVHVTPTQLSWHPLLAPKGNAKVNFFQSLKTMMGNGSPMQREGVVIHLYAANASMEKTAFVNSDGDFLIVPVEGRLDIQTEMGK